MENKLSSATNNLSEIAKNFIAQINVNSIATGFKNLDKCIRGMKFGDLIIVGGRPSMGTTSFLLSVLVNLIKTGTPTLFCTLKLSSKQVFPELIQIMSQVPCEKIDSSNFNSEEFEIILEKAKLVDNSAIIFNDKVNNIEELIMETELLVKQKNIKVVMIDSIQLVYISKEKNRDLGSEMLNICKKLKLMASTNNIVVIVASSLFRTCEERYREPRPEICDIMSSHNVAEVVDKVLFIYRAEPYGLVLKDEFGKSVEYNTEIIIAKNGDGKRGTIPFNFNSECNSFSDHIGNVR